MIIGLAGLKQSGKNTVASMLSAEYGFVEIAFADALRQALLILDPLVYYPSGYSASGWPVKGTYHRLNKVISQVGWDYAKENYPEVRRLMQVFGTEVGRALLGDNVWIDILAAELDLEDPSERYVITDVRFINEVEFVHRNSGSVIWIDRPGLVSDGHSSENPELMKYADHVVCNDDTIEELLEDVRMALFMKGVDPIEREVT